MCIVLYIKAPLINIIYYITQDWQAVNAAY